MEARSTRLLWTYIAHRHAAHNGQRCIREIATRRILNDRLNRRKAMLNVQLLELGRQASATLREGQPSGAEIVHEREAMPCGVGIQQAIHEVRGRWRFELTQGRDQELVVRYCC
jgi:hypothetical protein